MSERKVVSVFGSGAISSSEPEYRLAHGLGRSLAREGYTVSCGGYLGTMEAVARGATEAGGEVIGVTMDLFGSANPWVSREIRTNSLFERLEYLFNNPRAYVILRGGTGTLVELSVAWELLNKGLVPRSRPLIIGHKNWLPVIEELLNLPDIVASVNPHFPFPAPEFLYFADSVNTIMEIISSKVAVK